MSRDPQARALRIPRRWWSVCAAWLLRSCVAVLAGGSAGAAGSFDVRAFGAAGDGQTLDTPAINRAIEAAAAAGGGTIEFPAGDYLSFTIRLRSRVTLRLGQGATITAAEPPADLAPGYDAPEPNPGVNQYQDFGHSHWRNSLIWGENLEHIAIVGPGRIFGRGLSRGWDRQRRDFLPAERRLPPEQRPDLSFPAAAADMIARLQPGPFGYPGPDTLPAGVGNKAIALKNCRHVVLRDFTILHGGHFAILATGVDNWTCDNLTIDTNRDGIDIDACQNVRISNCAVNSPDDDAIVLKSSFALGRLRPTENVSIVNCHVSGYEEGTLFDGTRRRCEATRWGEPPIGRIKLGTEANGGFRNITIANCVFDQCRGIALEQVDGGALENVTISNLVMRDIGNAPIYLRLGQRLRGPPLIAAGDLRRVKIAHVVAQNVAGESGILILGTPEHRIEDVSIDEIFIEFAGGGTAEQARRVVPENETDYPEPTRHGVAPAWGLFARHVSGLSVSDLTLRTRAPDYRPALRVEQASNVNLHALDLPRAEASGHAVWQAVERLAVRATSGTADFRREEQSDGEF